jgi:hypothetical protein
MGEAEIALVGDVFGRFLNERAGLLTTLAGR